MDIINKNRVYWADGGFGNFGDYIAIPAGSKVGDTLGASFMRSTDGHLSLMGEYPTIEAAQVAAVKFAIKDRKSYRRQRMECAIGAIDSDGYPLQGSVRI